MASYFSAEDFFTTSYLKELDLSNDIKVGKVQTLDDLKRLSHPAWPYLQTQLKSVTNKEVEEFLRGAIDIHAHGAPDFLMGRPPTIETCKKASETGMETLILKDNSYQTSPVAYAMQEVLDEWALERELKATQIYGGVVLNYSVGGINPKAVEAALSGDFGKKTKCVWMPTFDAVWHYKMLDKSVGISTIDDNGKVKPEVKEIFQIIADSEKKVFVGTGHVSVQEMVALADEAKDAGVDLVATHANQEISVLTVEEAKDLVDRGAWIELSEVAMIGTPFVCPGWIVNFEHTMNLIKELGPEKIILATDAGQPGHAIVEAFSMMVRVLLSRGISEEDLTKMCKDNPAKISGIR